MLDNAIARDSRNGEDCRAATLTAGFTPHKTNRQVVPVGCSCAELPTPGNERTQPRAKQRRDRRGELLRPRLRSLAGSGRRRPGLLRLGGWGGGGPGRGRG